MYAAKSSGTGTLFYDKQQDAHTPERLALMVDLGNAVRENQLVLHYQPKIDLNSSRVIGCEALVRWSHPKMGMVPPGKFIHLAEMTDLIQPLTYWVVEESLRQLAEWHAGGLNLHVSVNLSTRNLMDQNCHTHLEELLAKYQVNPGYLDLEITETALMGDPDRALEQINRLTALGIQLSIDDFGTGFSSLAYLKQLPLHTLKIDRSFVGDMLNDQADLLIVRSTMNLAHSLGLGVVAEGVENHATAEALRVMGCEMAQGFHFCKPVDALTFSRWCRDNPLNLKTP
jgi:EAL domain-containing protein (putative c-di-GMP-specific phosphodiesterase class I)